MATIYESLVAWIKDIFMDPANEFHGPDLDIDVEVIPEWTEYQNAALYSNPNDTTKQLAGGQSRHIDFKTLYIKKDFITKALRVENEIFFEKLKKCIYKKNLDYDMPEDGRKWRSIEYAGGAYPSSKANDNKEAVYQITLKIVYEELG